jgi:DNA-binding transcriptional ArsR family regulator
MEYATMSLPDEPKIETISLAQVLHALSDTTRLMIIKRLHEDPANSCKSMDIPLAKSTQSQHFKVLRRAGIISVNKSGRNYILSLRSDDLRVRFPGLLEAVLSNLSSR